MTGRLYPFPCPCCGAPVYGLRTDEITDEQGEAIFQRMAALGWDYAAQVGEGEMERTLNLIWSSYVPWLRRRGPVRRGPVHRGPDRIQ